MATGTPHGGYQPSDVRYEAILWIAPCPAPNNSSSWRSNFQELGGIATVLASGLLDGALYSTYPNCVTSLVNSPDYCFARDCVSHWTGTHDDELCFRANTTTYRLVPSKVVRS
ncbi:hypothetical protein M404DRAFT_992817 [Pisolithus tinctorius Marx 270]|uniref:Uncharacterized protein n=1 Tax=Pisolithus tinctorius Marx 270 TaxID=870435 RepID=A0A0C3PVF4_PISTI|nr:hypothetical protein M404DRAFT_992817 [Pisolithus tinctorius Marx 270]